MDSFGGVVVTDMCCGEVDPGQKWGFDEELCLIGMTSV